MKLQISIIILLILSFTISSGFIKPGDSNSNIDTHLFKIGRNRDANEILYDINLNQSGEPDISDPIKIYWIKRTRDNRIDPLTWIQNKYAYGIKVISVSNNENEIDFQFVSYDKRTFTLKKTDKNNYKVFTVLGLKEIEITRIFVHIEGGSFWLPSVSSVELHGIESKSGETILENIIP